MVWSSESAFIIAGLQEVALRMEFRGISTSVSVYLMAVPSLKVMVGAGEMARSIVSLLSIFPSATVRAASA